MAYSRTLPILASGALVLAFATGRAALAQTSDQATAGASTTISERAGIQTTGEVIFQDIAVTPSVTVAPVIDSTSNSQITVLGQGGDAVSLAVSDAINMTKTNGEQTLTVITNADGSYAVPLMQGVLSPDGVLSVNVGGTLQTASQQLQPGEYRGVLVVVAQYN
ncbi:MAG: DUF4402 domain-containing protein [Parcubacteria group bacterium]